MDTVWCYWVFVYSTTQSSVTGVFYTLHTGIIVCVKDVSAYSCVNDVSAYSYVKDVSASKLC